MASSARIDELRKKFEENPRRYFAPLANEYRKAGDVDQAIAICREYLPQQPGHMSGHIVFGQALYEARQFEEAKTVFETALSLDPENLIALRHLGDIALIIGDTDAARGWYRRVLEADPRNEEIQAQLATLDAAGPSAALTPPVGIPEIPPPTPAKPTPVSSTAATVVVSAADVQAEVARRMAARAQESAPLELESAVTGAQLGEPEAPAASMALDGLETTSLAPPPLPLERAEESGEAPPSLSTVRTVEIDLDRPIHEQPFAISDTHAAPPGAAETTKRPVPAEAAAAVPELIDLSTPAEPPPASLPADGEREQHIGDVRSPTHAHEPSAPVATRPQAPDSGPFVTETMAELYLQQGHREEALRVYRALLEQRPDDASLRSKIDMLMTPARSPQPERHAVPAPPSASGDGGSAETIREVLNRVALRRPGFKPEASKQNGAPLIEPPASEAPATEARAMEAQPAKVPPENEVAADSMTAFFAGHQVSSADESAARALALAFMSNGGAGIGEAAMSGAPARRASNELSLDSVFKSGDSPAPSSFSFDQFFSQRGSSQPAPTASPQAADASAPDDDAAHFTQWLEGLKGR